MNMQNLAAMMAVGGAAATQQDAIGETGQKLIDAAKVAVVQQELGQIRTAFTSEMAAQQGRADRKGRPINNLHHVKKNFSDFIRAASSPGKRDPAFDLWENPYTLNEQRELYEIVSFGPDGADGTDDDLWVEIPK